MSAAAIGDLTVAAFILIVVFFVFGVLATVYEISTRIRRRQMWWIILGVVLVVVAFIIWFGLDASI